MTGSRDQDSSSRYMPAAPDPTELTTEAVDRVTLQFQRELAGLHELHDKDLTAMQATWTAQLDGLDQQRALLWEEIHAWPGNLEARLTERRREFEGEVANVRRNIEQRLDAMDRAIDVSTRERDRFVQALLGGYDTRIAANREYAAAQLDIYITQARERFDSVQGQFSASKEAVDAAFDAASKAVAEQNRVISLALDKSDATTADQITALSRVTDAGLAGLADKIDDARNRITTIESLTQGIEKAGGEQRQERGLQHSGVQIALFAFAVLVSIAAIVVSVALHH